MFDPGIEALQAGRCERQPCTLAHSDLKLHDDLAEMRAAAQVSIGCNELRRILAQQVSLIDERIETLSQSRTILAGYLASVN
jgi:hypothetical protein